jgi:PEP-CTERM motif
MKFIESISIRAASLALVAFCAVPAVAAPVSYNMRFVVSGLEPGFGTDPRIRVGNIYLGSFTVDDSILSTPGTNRLGLLSNFTISLNDANFTMPRGSIPDPLNYFSGFYGPAGLGSNSPGFDVSGGVITNLRGGVFSGSDSNFFAFSDDRGFVGVDPTCISRPGNEYCGNAPGRFYAVFALPLGSPFSLGERVGMFGAMTIAAAPVAVPEPGTLVLGLLALCGMAASAMRRSVARSTRNGALINGLAPSEVQAALRLFTSVAGRPCV